MDDDDRRREAAARNRARFPLTALELDGWRAVFGPDVRLLCCDEGGVVTGTPTWPERSLQAPGAPALPGPDDDRPARDARARGANYRPDRRGN